MQRKYFGTTSNGVPVHVFQLESRSGVRVELMEYGASVVSIELPDRHGRRKPVVVGYPDLERYLASAIPFGATLGRYSGRISDFSFWLDGSLHSIASAPGARHHEGCSAFGLQRAVWWGEALREGVRFHCTSPAMEAGFPAAVDCSVEYRLNDSGDLSVVYRALADAATIIDLSNQIYFNFCDGGSTSVLDHKFWIAADEVIERDRCGAATGHFLRISERRQDRRSAIHVEECARGATRAEFAFDPSFVLDGSREELAAVAGLWDPRSGCGVEIATNQPGICMALDGRASEGAPKSLCLLPQNFPDAPKHAHFPSAIVDVDRPYSRSTIFRFHWEGDSHASPGFAG